MAVDAAPRPVPAGRLRFSLRWALAPYLLLLAGWLVLIGVTRWNVNPDGVVYASLADHLASGRPGEAITGYWSPLLPVLAAPLVALGVPTLFALRLVLLLTALAALPVIRDLARRAGAQGRAVVVSMLLAVPLLLSAAVFGVYPELLLAVTLLVHVRSVLAGTSTRAAVIAGGWGAAAYLSKAVGLPFVVAFVVLVALGRLVGADGAARTQAVRAAGLTLGVTLAACLPWIIAISINSGTPTISTAGSFNAALTAPGVKGNPLSFPGLYQPRTDAAVTPWEDPRDLPIPRVAAAVGQPDTASDRASNTVDQAKVAVGSLLRRWWAVLPLVGWGLCLAWRRERAQRFVVVACTGAAVLFTAGLSTLVIVERYLWFPLLALLPAAAVALQDIGERDRRWLTRGGPAVAGLVSVSLLPVVASRVGQDREVWQLADRVRAQGPVTGSVAGAGSWERSQLLAYLLGVDYVGLTGTDTPADQLPEQLRRVGAAHVVVWSTAPPGLGDGPALYDLTAQGLVRR